MDEKKHLSHDYRVHSCVKVTLKAAMPALLFFSSSFFFLLCTFNCGYADHWKTKQPTERLLAIGCDHVRLFQKIYTLYSTVHYNGTLDFVFIMVI